MRAFVAMPFAADFDPYWKVIEDVCRKKEISTFRIDRNLSFERHIDIAIRREIRDSDLVIAILTGDRDKAIPNPNVAFEVGYAQGLGMETILLAERVEHLPFDFQQQRTCIYEGDVEKFREGLEKEISSLYAMLRKSYQKTLKEFFAEIGRCLRIVLPAKYRVFDEWRGIFDDKIWFGIVYHEYKRRFGYIIYTRDLKDLTLACWLSEEELRPRQKEFFKKHNDILRKRLGYDILLEFAEKSHRPELRNKELTKETIAIETKTPGTKEALAVALRMTEYVEAFEPLCEEFEKELAEQSGSSN